MDLDIFFEKYKETDFKFTEEQTILFNHYKHLYGEELSNRVYEIKAKLKNEGVPHPKRVFLARVEALKEIIAKDEAIQIAEGVWECPICGLHIKDMGAHTKRVHNYLWEDFVRDYDWRYSKIFYSESHRAHLSENKKYFYNLTDRGIEAKKVLSERFSGKSNPACSLEIRKKISKSRMGKCFLSDKALENISKRADGINSVNYNSRGYTFWSIVDGRERRFRSKIEYTIYIMLKYYGIPFEYEPLRIEYREPNVPYCKHYIVDYIIHDRMFEVKDTLRSFESESKYVYIQNQLRANGKKLELLTLKNFFEVLSIDENGVLPLSFFEDLVIQSIRNGECRVKLPGSKTVYSKLNTSFLRKLGENPLDIIEKGNKVYEDKKCNRGLQ